MNSRPSFRELFGVLIGDAGVMTAGVALGSGLFLFTPLFVVAYSVVWAWPLAASGDRVTVSRSRSAAVGGAQDGASPPSLDSGRESARDAPDATENAEVEAARRLSV